MNADNDIAIVGMAAHLPGAGDVGTYWHNLRQGLRSIRQLSEDELLAAGEARHVMARPDYVPFAAPLDRFDHFDAEFFGFSPKDAAIMDPQHRQFLEVIWEALENAGHMPEDFNGPVGVFGGCGMGSYFYFNICSNPDLVQDVGMFLLRHTGNDKDFLTTRASHVFNLTGPSVNVQTACSTSLVAVHYAVQSLLTGESDMAIAGGVTIELPQNRGYIYKDGEILSPDGECHAFDHRAQGTVFGSGAGAVVLRRLSDAIADGDHIWGVIKGTAINNDGAAKAGYLAPSVDGQSAAIVEAQAVAGVSPDTVGYIECHGTGTYLGDPIEVAALTEAFRQGGAQGEGFCRIGSVKTNIGHLDTAAGVASLIKTTLALHHGQIPPSLGYEAPNPVIGFEGSPFTVNDRLTDWPRGTTPRRAGVNSLGVGGTNAHVVLEEAPLVDASGQSDFPFQPLVISARSKAALDEAAQRLADHLEHNPDQPLPDVAFTLRHGRRAFEQRRVIVAETHAEASATLRANDPRRVFTHKVLGDAPDVVFMFPGGGAQYAGMARDLYDAEPVFRDWMDRGLDVLQAKLDYDIRALWLPAAGQEAAADERLKQPSVQLPLIMIVEYALAQLWISWGVKPAALVGHSMGENTAACVAGIMSFEDCIGLVHLRGTLFDTVPAGGMLSVGLPAEDLRPLLGDDLDLGAVNGPALSVASGPQAALDRLQAELEAREVEFQRIPIDIAAHSRMLEPILQRFGDYLRSIKLNAPQIPVMSNRTGQILSDAQAMDPYYWVGHLRGTVLFADCIATLAADAPKGQGRVFLEVGPGKGLASLAGQHANVTPNAVIGSLRHPQDHVADDAYFMAMLARMWAVGVAIDWDQIWGGVPRNRVPLPSYAFQRSRYFIEPGKGAQTQDDADLWPLRSDNLDAWGYRPAWVPRLAECDVDFDNLSDLPTQNWLVFEDDAGLGATLTAKLRAANQQVITVRPADAFARAGKDGYLLAPEQGRAGYDQLVRDLVERGMMPDRIVHLWQVTRERSFRPGSSFFHRTQEQGFYSLLFLAQALAEENATPHIQVVTSDAAQVRAEPLTDPDKSTIMGPARIIPREVPGMSCAVLDIRLPKQGKRRDQAALDALADRLLEDLLAAPANTVAALRGDKRFALEFKPTPLAKVDDTALPLRDDGVTLITGGFGGIGLSIAGALIARGQKHVVLIARSPLPPRPRWDALVQTGVNDATVQRIRAVQALEAQGGNVLVLQADVSNIEDMRAACAQTEAEFGPVTAVIHAAGVIHDAPLLTKSLTEIEDVFTPKIHGTKVLEELFPDGTLDWMVLFSSSSTVTAPVGQVDYVAANEYLNAYAKSRKGGKTRVLAIDWGVWSGVGMAADAMAARLAGDAPPERRNTPADTPLLSQITQDESGHRLFLKTLDARAEWVLDDHRTKAGDAVMPGTGYLQLAAASLRAQGEVGGFEIRDLYFLSPLQVPDGSTLDMQVRLPRADAGYGFEVQTVQPTGTVTHAEAELSLLPLSPPESLDLDAIAKRCAAPETADAGSYLPAPQEAHLAFGPRWHVIRSMALGQDEGLAWLSLPEPHAADLTQGWGLHPGLMDLATGWAMNLIAGYRPDHLWVPVSYGSVRVHRPLPARVASWVRSRKDNSADGPSATFDVVITAPDGTVCIEVEGFSIRRLENTAAFGRAAAPVKAATNPQTQSGPRPLSPAEERLRHLISQGIQPSEGSEAFLRALAGKDAQIVISSLDLSALIRQANAVESAADTSGQSFERPKLDSDFVAPETEVEKRLAGFWQELLGLDSVGVEDSFFDLGGHSLIAVRLFAKVRKAFAVDFPISVLFEAPTIRKCAALIEERGVVPGAEAAPDSAAKPATPQRRFTHVVPMHSGEGGTKTPFFLVAGMFGNILNLRHLAHLLGTDRPFYGLQARGLYGDQEPHRDLKQAAADYIAEMRQVQPQGPYMLGGFSGGGITALEIAQQLTAAGEDVSALVMLDTPLPVRRGITRRDRALIQWQELRAAGPAYLGRWAANRIRWEIEKRRPKSDDFAEPAAQFHNVAIEAAFMESVTTYPLRHWDGPLTLFRPPLVGKWQVAPDRLINADRNYVLHDNDWTAWAPRVDVQEVPGDHDSMVLEPNVRVLAARMRRVIEAAERRSTPRNLRAVAGRDVAQEAAE
nr:SDR family NAD(P)-dependent oxidoreductase [Seohaeicola saemankumensis]